MVNMKWNDGKDIQQSLIEDLWCSGDPMVGTADPNQRYSNTGDVKEEEGE